MVQVWAGTSAVKRLFEWRSGAMTDPDLEPKPGPSELEGSGEAPVEMPPPPPWPEEPDQGGLPPGRRADGDASSAPTESLPWAALPESPPPRRRPLLAAVVALLLLFSGIGIGWG